MSLRVVITRRRSLRVICCWLRGSNDVARVALLRVHHGHKSRHIPRLLLGLRAATRTMASGTESQNGGRPVYFIPYFAIPLSFLRHSSVRPAAFQAHRRTSRTHPADQRVSASDRSRPRSPIGEGCLWGARCFHPAACRTFVPGLEYEVT